MSKRKPDRDPFDRYFTAPVLARRIVEWAFPPGAPMTTGRKRPYFLEPSAGNGHLLLALRELLRARQTEADVVAVEICPEQQEKLEPLIEDWPGTLSLVKGDFLRLSGPREKFDLALMNPPFSDGADGRHVQHALRMSERVVALLRTNFEHTAGRYFEVMAHARIQRRAVMVRRPPPFLGPGDRNEGPMSDYVALDLVKRPERQRSEPGAPTRPEDIDTTQVEYWL